MEDKKQKKKKESDLENGTYFVNYLKAGFSTLWGIKYLSLNHQRKMRFIGKKNNTIEVWNRLPGALILW